MITRLLYVLSSTDSDTYLESALISIYSARLRMPDVNITLLVDDITNDFFIGKRVELLNLIDLKIVVKFDIEIDLYVRSRLLKTNMRNYLTGDFLYVDCDTLIACQLYDIDSWQNDIAAVLDGHSLLNEHPVIDIFTKQSNTFDYPFEETMQYFSSGVMYVKDSILSKQFFDTWHSNYKLGLSLGIKQDEPSLAKTNHDFSRIISELPGEWNCQIRLGALYLNNLKILHFWSKKNMPLSSLGSKELLNIIKIEGIVKYKNLIIDYQKSFYMPLGLISKSDLYFNFSPLYEITREQFINEGEIIYFKNGLSFLEKTDKSISKSKIGKIIIRLNRIIFRLEFFIFSKLTNSNNRL